MKCALIIAGVLIVLVAIQPAFLICRQAMRHTKKVALPMPSWRK